ncbi:MAG: RNA-binding domain-containing protein [Halobacteriota archaeon]
MSFIESETQELKKSTAQLERALKAVCGFLNHKGGIIYFGILFGVSRNTASKDLNDLVEKRIVKRAGEGKRSIRYLLN